MQHRYRTAIEFARFLESGMQKIEQRRRWGRAAPYEAYRELVRHVAASFLIEHVPVEETTFQERLRATIDATRTAFFAWVEEMPLVACLRVGGCQKYDDELTLLTSLEGPDPELFRIIAKCGESWRVS